MTRSLAPSQAPAGSAWTPADSERLYALPAWGQGWFGVNERGHVVVRPDKHPGREVDLLEIVEGLRERGYSTPVLLRFTDLLDHRLREIRAAFDRAIDEAGYLGSYHCVYPIKVNQQQLVCHEVRALADELGFGFEAGSKPELLAVLALTAGSPMPIVCNGFKDEEFLETVVLATKLGRNITTVIEKESELGILLRLAKRYRVRPRIGIRVKLSSRGAGRWESSGGVRSKFGLFVSEVLGALEILKEEGMEDCFELLHCHIGSQVHDVRSVQEGVNELARVYCELHRLGAGLRILDVGGGLGVDYDGSRTNWPSSTNYGLDEYAESVVGRVMAVCDQAGVPHPSLYTESGRAMTAYSSVLVTNVLGRSGFDPRLDPASIRRRLEMEEAPQPLLDLLDAWEELAAAGDEGLLPAFHRAGTAHEEALTLFKLGYLDLTWRSCAEELYWAICNRVWKRARDLEEIPEELQPLESSLSDIYFCNFSIFQSMPDAWAIEQIFPICPIHRLDRRPERRAVLADITCDSDGQIRQFADDRQDRIKPVLEVHDLQEEEPYYLGFFLVGAYQEILGDLHNLLGDTHAVHIRIDAEGRWEPTEIVPGDTVREVLGYVNFRPEALEDRLRRDIEAALRAERLTVAEGRSLLQAYREGLQGYTYLEDPEPILDEED